MSDFDVIWNSPTRRGNFRLSDHEIRSRIVTSKTAGGDFVGFPPSGFRCCEHFGKKVVNIFIHNLGVADLDPMSKSSLDPFL